MKNFRHLQVKLQRITDLRPYARNVRTHSAKQIRQIADSISALGFCNPVLIDGDGVVIAGHGRIEGAKLLGMEQIPTIRLTDMTPAQVRAYALADNKLAENAGWDKELVAVELQYLTELDIDLDLTVTGFETAEIDLLLETAPDDNSEAENEFADELNPGPAVSQPGDLWKIGDHRLLCGDATKLDSYVSLLSGERAHMVFTDPPYNVRIGEVSGLGKSTHREFAMASGEMSELEFISFLTTALSRLVTHTTDGSIHFVCMDWRHCFELLSAARAVNFELKNLCIWAKNNGGMGSLYRSQHELVFVFKNGHAAHVNNVELGKHGRSRTNVWQYPGLSSFGQQRPEELRMHPTVKPVALIADAILDCSRRRNLVLDCFGGSGSTLIACERTGRIGRVMEIDPAYIDVTIRRFRRAFGKDAVHATTGHCFTVLENERIKERPNDIGNPAVDTSSENDHE